MAHYIDKDALVAEIEKWINGWTERLNNTNPSNPSFFEGGIEVSKHFLSFINSLEVKEVDLELITGWFDHIAQIADDRMTLTNQRMTDAHALDEIKCLAKNSSEFITKHYKAQKGE